MNIEVKIDLLHILGAFVPAHQSRTSVRSFFAETKSPQAMQPGI